MLVKLFYHDILYIAHDCIIGDNCIMANAVNPQNVNIENNVVGGIRAVKQFLTIGKFCMVSGVV